MEERYLPLPESLKQHETPAWFSDAKFGIFIHWGIYSVPAFGDEWYCQLMHTGRGHWALRKGLDPNPETIKEYHARTYGASFRYHEFLSLWKPDRFDAEQWMELFASSGARYVIPVAMHHDSFALYESSLTPWNTVEKGIGTESGGWKTVGGQGRDFMKELQLAAKRRGLKFGLSNHVAENCRWVPHAKEYGTDYSRSDEDPYQLRLLYGSDFTDEEDACRWLALNKEIIERFHPDCMYFDMELREPRFDSVKRQFAADYYNDAVMNNSEGVLFFYKADAFEEGEAVEDVERGQISVIAARPWQSDTSLSPRSWGFVQNDTCRPSSYCIATLIDVVSKNGNLLLNVSPRADGSIPEAQEKTLRETGAWLSKYGKAVYGTKPWSVHGEGPSGASGYCSESNNGYSVEDFRFTRSGSTLYVFSLVPQPGSSLCIKSLGGLPVQNVSLVCGDKPVVWRVSDKGLLVDISSLSSEVKAEPMAFAVELKGGMPE